MMGTLEKSYAIHQTIMASRSKYFQRLMFGGYYSESHQKQTSMELPREFCKSGVVSMKDFETFLDWCYWEQVKLTPSNAIGVMCLSDYFCADDLKAETEVCIENFLQSCNFQQQQQQQQRQNDAKVKAAGLAILYRNAKITGLEHIQDAVANICARNPSYMSKEFKLTESLRDVDFWVAVFQRKASGRKLRSVTGSEESWSTYFADYIRDYPETVDAESFKFLTSKAFLPKLSNSAASCLMEHEMRLLGTDSNTFSSSSTGKVVLDRDPKNERVEPPTCLQQRCIEALFEQGSCIKALYD
uniref:BTB domain-containing protein n=2 Tax=Pseudo-nitzschia australis TaxID=44445 RepID=A0A7S4EM11_9STRA